MRGTFASKLKSVFVVGFFLTVALSLTGYIDSSFVGTRVSLERVGLLFSLGSGAAIIFLAYLPKLLERVGTTRAFHIAGLAYLVSVICMLQTSHALLFQALFVVYMASGIGLYFILDMLIEHFSKSGTTGTTRGLWLVIYNVGYLIGPLIAGLVADTDRFELVYLLAGLCIITMMLIYARDLEDVVFRSHHNGKSLLRNMLRLSKRTTLWPGYAASFALAFFFSWMAIYTPIYLHEFMGFDWATIGGIFAIMHIPYITLELPIGHLIDRCRCEDRIVAAGFAIIALTTASLALIENTDFAIWAIGLALTRVGASLVQVGSESNFFKHISDKDADMVAVFRNATPVAYLVGPLLGTLALTVVSYQGMFVVLGGIMLVCTSISLWLKTAR